MKALAIALAILSASSAFAAEPKQTTEVKRAPAADEAPQNAELKRGPSSFPADEAPQNAELRRSPPPGRPMPQPQPPPPSRNLAVVDREELAARMARLERLLEDVEDRLDGRGGDYRGEARNKLRRAQETLDSLQQFVGEAPPLGAVQPLPSPAPQPPPPPPAPVVRPMPDSNFKRMSDAMAREQFAEDKMRVLKMAAGGNYFLISQVGQLMTQFQFSQDKLTVVRELKPRILDPENGYQLYSAFSFSSDKQRLQEILAQR
ncbi:DUF4476 domain-containing protein [Pyxidicoccus parkwayensis]|uniref:DUF4476 domain-containing protein n=1 Tax=Pyxidicoccus parkwayensis TaxID=2813578 RepID=A0ABX7NZA3_9BACT|nr:DUF4476 domain-containing protein [Pyxidicoccus parkwaysis]QSQ24140.1 DUF4476 domain-containing protein [Pyxidicoccus parkwaysis]